MEPLLRSISKEQLEDAVVNRFLAGVNAKMELVLGSNEPPLRRCESVIRAVELEYAGATGVILLHRDFPDLWEQMNALRLEKLKVIEDLIREAKEVGHVRREVDPSIAYLMFVTAVQQVVAPSILLSHGLCFNELISQVLDIFIRGIAQNDAEKGE